MNELQRLKKVLRCLMEAHELASEAKPANCPNQQGFDEGILKGYETTIGVIDLRLEELSTGEPAGFLQSHMACGNLLGFDGKCTACQVVPADVEVEKL